MTEERFKYVYPIRIKQSKDFSDLRPICVFMHEIACCEDDELDKSLEFAKLVEQDLVNRGILSFKIERFEDIYKVNTSDLPGKIQWFICLLFHRMR